MNKLEQMAKTFLNQVSTFPEKILIHEKPEKSDICSEDFKYSELISRWEKGNLKTAQRKELETLIISIIWSLADMQRAPRWAKTVFRGTVEDIPTFFLGHWIGVAKEIVEKESS